MSYGIILNMSNVGNQSGKANRAPRFMIEVPDVATRNRFKAVAAAKGTTPGELLSDYAKELELATFGKRVVADPGDGGQGAGQQQEAEQAETG